MIRNVNFQKRKTEILFFAVLLVGIFLRFYGLSIQSLWFDEIASLGYVTEYDFLTLLTDNVDSSHPPLYYLVLKLTVHLFGNAEWIIRLPSAIAGSLSIAAIFFLGKKLYGKKEGLIAAIILSFSTFTIFYSQEARSYSMFLLFSIVSVYFLIDIIRLQTIRPGKLLHIPIAGYIVSSLLLIYTSYLGGFFVALQGLFLGVRVLKRPKHLCIVLGMYLLIFLGFLPWLGHFFYAVRNGPSWIPAPYLTLIGKHMLGIHAFDAPGLWGSIRNYINFRNPLNLYSHPQQLLIIIPSLFFIFRYKYILQSFKLAKWKSIKRISLSTILLLLWAVVPYTIIYMKSIIGSPSLLIRAIIFIVPAIYLLEARLLCKIQWKEAEKIIFAILIVFFCFKTTSHYYTGGFKENFRQTATYVLEKTKESPATISVISQAPSEVFGYNYYFKKLSDQKEFPIITMTTVDLETLKNIQPFWVVYGHSAEGFYKEELQKHFQLVEEINLYSAGAYLYSGSAPSKNPSFQR